MKMTLNGLWNEDSAENKLSDLIKKSNNILDKIISDNEYTSTYVEIENEYEPDSSPIAWKYYKIMYGDMIDEGQGISSAIRIQGLFNYKKKSIEQETYGDLELGKIALAGDCVFNFNEKKVKGFKKLLNAEKKDHDLQNKLRLCEKMHHSPYNFSLMPVTGGMNNQKRSLSGYDRPDVLLYAISKFYEKDMTELTEKTTENYDRLIELQGELQIIQHRGITDLCAYHFLATIGSFENYVRIFYHLDYDNPIDQSLIEAMLTMGQQPIDNPKALEAYMNLAIAYWKIQRSKYEYIQSHKELLNKVKQGIDELLNSVIDH